MRKKISKELREWVILLGVIGILFWTGWYKDVAGFLQRGLLETGLMQPSVSEVSVPADYDFVLTDVNGRPVPFESFQGHTVFMNFWATWCPPCIAEMPDIHDLYEKVGTDVKFVMISVDRNHKVAKEFLRDKGFEFPVYFLRSGLPPTYQTSIIPSTYVLSPEGRVVVEEHGLSKYDTKKFREFLLGLKKN